jgi:ABC-type Na+ efflux pump permease subunit
MLSIFPWLFNYSQVAPLILRIVLAVALVALNFSRMKNEDRYLRVSAGAQCLAALSLFLGIFTQAGALLAIIAIIADVIKKQRDKLLGLLIFAIALSLLFSGPGLFSLDLPL